MPMAPRRRRSASCGGGNIAAREPLLCYQGRDEHQAPSKPPLALIAGPTASGKSALALALAEQAGGVVINADSAQVYRDLRIVSARPGAADEARAPHRLYGYRDGADACSAADWAADAKAAIAEAHRRGPAADPGRRHRPLSSAP